MKKVFTTLVILGIIGVTAALVHFLRPAWSPLALLGMNSSSEKTVLVTRDELEETLKVNNAHLVPKETFELSFSTAGTVEDIFVVEDQLIYDPIPLIKIDTATLELERKKALAVLRQHQTNISKLKSGTRPESLSVTGSATKAAKTVLANTKTKFVDAFKNAYSDTDDAIRNKADQMILNPRSDSPETDFTASDSNLENDIESEREALEDNLEEWADEADDLSTSGNLSKRFQAARKRLEKAQEFLDDLALAVNSLSAGGGLSQDTLDTWKDALATARTTVGTTTSALSTAYANYQNAGQDLTTSESTLSLEEAGTLSHDLDIAQFQLEEAQSALDVATEKLAEATLHTPHSHLLVKKIFPKIQEHVAASEPVILLATPELKIELDIPEEDMAGIAIGKKITLNLEAFPGATPPAGEITTIEPQEITKNGSIYYRVFAHLTEQQPEWRAGMSGDASVTIGELHPALQVPRSAVYTKKGKKMIQHLGWYGQPEEKEVVVGIKNETSMEILEGLEEDDTVIRYPSALR